MAAAGEACSSSPQASLREVPKAMLRVPRSSMAATEKACASLSPVMVLRLPQPMAASSTSFTGEGTAEPVRPSGQDSNAAPRPGPCATRGKRPRGIFQDEALTLAEINLIATAARWPESCREGAPGEPP